MWLRVNQRGELSDTEDGFNTAHFGKSHANRQLGTDCKVSDRKSFKHGAIPPLVRNWQQQHH